MSARENSISSGRVAHWIIGVLGVVLGALTGLIVAFGSGLIPFSC